MSNEPKYRSVIELSGDASSPLHTELAIRVRLMEDDASVLRFKQPRRALKLLGAESDVDHGLFEIIPW